MVALLALTAAGKAILYDTLDPDCFWHLRVAEALHRQGIGPLVDDLSFASNKTPWTPYSWLAELGMKWVWDMGGYRLAVATQAIMQAGIVILLAMIGCAAAIGRPERARYLSIILLTAFGMAMMLPYLSFRPATAAILLLGIIFWLIVRDRQLNWRSKEGRLAGQTHVNFSGDHFTSGASLFPPPVIRGRVREGVLTRIWRNEPPPQPSPGIPGEGEKIHAFALVWAAIPLTILLTNIHLYAVFVPVMCGVVVVGAIWNRQWHLARRYGLLTAACAIGCLLTPMLKGTIQTAWFYQHTDAMVAGPIIAEMRPFLDGTGGKILGVMILLMIAAAVRYRKQLDLSDWLWLGLGLVLLLRLGRFAPLFAILSMPAFARGLQFLSDRVLDRPILRGALAGVFIIGLVRVGMAFPRTGNGMDQWLNRHGPETPGYPTSAADFVQMNVHPRTGHLINEFTWGGYLSWRLGGQYQVLLDGRTQLYSQDFWRSAYLGDEIQRSKWLDQIEADAAVLPTERSIFSSILIDHGWTIAYRDQRAQILLPPSAQVADVK